MRPQWSTETIGSKIRFSTPPNPAILAVLDWELSTLGHPLADLAYNCLSYHLPSGELSGYGYLGLNLVELGIPTEADYVAAYCRRTGRQVPSDWTFFIAFSLFRLAAIVQGVYKRGLDGIASSDNARRYGAYAHFLADSRLAPGRRKSILKRSQNRTKYRSASFPQRLWAGIQPRSGPILDPRSEGGNHENRAFQMQIRVGAAFPFGFSINRVCRIFLLFPMAEPFLELC